RSAVVRPRTSRTSRASARPAWPWPTTRREPSELQAAPQAASPSVIVMAAQAMSLVPTPPPELQFTEDDGPGDVCRRLAGYAMREAEAAGTRRFFSCIAIALGR